MNRARLFSSSRLRILALAAACSWALTGVARAAIPDLNGTWEAITPPSALRTESGALPPLLPAAQAIYEAHRKALGTSKRDFDTTTRCLPPGVPRILYEPQPFEILQRDAYLVMLFEYQHLTREVFFADKHPPLVNGRRFLGDSIAHWDGQTLVVDTSGMKDGTLLDAAGLPHSKSLHVTERYQLLPSGNELEARISIEDPSTFTQPWETRLRFRRVTAQFAEDVCTDRHPEWFSKLKQSEQ
ncbi:MAG: hypothetical protein ABSE43_11625 [Steroidobacteraceae bacterium]